MTTYEADIKPVDRFLMERFVTDWSGPEAVLKSLAIRLGAPNLPGMLGQDGPRVRQLPALHPGSGQNESLGCVSVVAVRTAPVFAACIAVAPVPLHLTRKWHLARRRLKHLRHRKAVAAGYRQRPDNAVHVGAGCGGRADLEHGHRPHFIARMSVLAGRSRTAVEAPVRIPITLERLRRLDVTPTPTAHKLHDLAGGDLGPLAPGGIAPGCLVPGLPVRGRLVPVWVWGMRHGA